MDTPPNQKEKRMLITGASGFLGYNLCKEALDSGYSVYALVNKRPISKRRVTTISGNVSDAAFIGDLFTTVKPHAVIHAAALADPNACQKDPKLSYLVNVGGSQNIARAAQRHNAHCAFISTDLVFDGTKAPYTEDSPVCPISVYGEHKVVAEQSLIELCERGIICRMPLMFGYGGEKGASFLKAMISALRNNQPLKLFSDEYRTPLDGVSAAQGILKALTLHKKCLHLGGSTRISRLDFGKKVAAVLGISATIEHVLHKDVTMPAPRPADVSFDSSRAVSLGYNPLAMEIALAEECTKIEACLDH